MKRKFVLLFCLILIVSLTGVTVLAISNAPVFEPISVADSTDQYIEDCSKAEVSTILDQKNESITKDELYDRMLNTVDYFSYASVEFQYHDNAGLWCSEIHTNMPESKAYSVDMTDDYNGEMVSDGKALTQYHNTRKTVHFMGAPLTNDPNEKTFLEKSPRHFVDSDGIDNWIYRQDITNGSLSSVCLFPQGYTFGFLTDQNSWNISGETELFGRVCLVVTGISEQYGKKFGIFDFTMIIDKSTGILIELSGTDIDGNIVELVKVTNLIVDDPEYTNSKIDVGIQNCKTHLDYDAE